MSRRASTLALTLVVGVGSALGSAQSAAEDRGPVVVRPATAASAPADTTAASGTRTAARAPECSQLMAIGVPGNGEGSGASEAPRLGPTLSGLLSQVAGDAATAGRSMETLVLPGETEPVSTLWPTAAARGSSEELVGRDDVRRWRGVLGPRVDALSQAVRDAVASCPERLVLLVGHAQGAMVVHRSLVALDDEPAVTARIAAATLVADGDRTPRDPVAGDPRPRAGTGLARRLLRPPTPLGSLRSPTTVLSVCTEGDVVCDLGRTGLRAGSRIHRTYDGSALLARVALHAWRQVAAWPVPSPQSLSVSTEAGQPFDLQLAAQVSDAHADHVVWSRGAGLPEGLSLDASGRLLGAPTETGEFTVSYRVRNDATPQRRPGIGGVVHLTVTPATVGGPSAGATHTCSVARAGTLWCWGNNEYGQLGIDSTAPTRLRTQVGDSDGWTQVSAGTTSTCALRAGGAAYCWGLNHHGQLGTGDRRRRLHPVRLDLEGWASVSVGAAHACGLRTDGSAWCWGANDAGQLGTGTLQPSLTPVRVEGDAAWTSLSAGGWHTCGTRADGTAWCWGRNLYGEVGDGTTVQRVRPVRVDDRTDWAAVSVSWTHSCGLSTSGVARCWGSNARGTLGDGTAVDRREPTRVETDARFLEIEVAESHSCGITGDRALLCWGSNRYGQFGVSTGDARTPVPAGSAGSWSRVSMGAWTTCGLLAGGEERCWGNNEFGQVGDGTTQDRLRPVAPTR